MDMGVINDIVWHETIMIRTEQIGRSADARRTDLEWSSAAMI